jgi:N-ethylmaleimide reductase
MSQNLKNLFQPIKFARQTFRNRIIMSAMTRCRADSNTQVPNELMAKYYTERAEKAGIVFTECVGVSRVGNCYVGGTSIYADEQVAGWKIITDSVHKVGGKIFIQIWHGGRASRSSIIGSSPVSSSPIPIRTKKKEDGTFETEETPKELTKEEITYILGEFEKGASNAIKAGFDGIEIHGANGYLVDCFLRSSANTRKDEYGGNVENRTRFPLQVIDVIAKIWGYDRTGIKLSPTAVYQDMYDPAPIPLYTHLLQEMKKRKVGFVEFVQPSDSQFLPNFYGIPETKQLPNCFQTFRPHFDGVFIGNNGLNAQSADKLIQDGIIDMATFGRPFLSNPDFPDRIKNGWKLSDADFSKLYTPGPEGYTTYPKYNH